MKVRGDIAPPGAFSIDPSRNGMCLVRLYQNPREFTETREGQTETGWEYEEYHIQQVWWSGLEANIEANYQVFLDAAKEAEIDKSNAALYRNAQETAASLENAMCEQDADTDMRLSDIELALCELDERTA